MSDVIGEPAIPDPAERARHNTALHNDNIETGFWDEHGRPAPGPTISTNSSPKPATPPTTSPPNKPSNQHNSKDQPLHHFQGLDRRDPVAAMNDAVSRSNVAWRVVGVYIVIRPGRAGLRSATP